jgi:hypothetical protein
MKHKHADLIHAWADGAEIQRYNPYTEWETERFPNWNPDNKYRIKPEKKNPVVRWLWATKDALGNYQRGQVFWSDDERNNLSNRDAFIKLEWSRTEFPE